MSRKAPGTLLVHTHALLEACDKPLPQIHAETGISFYWLRHFKSRRYQNPSVNTIQQLWEYLSGRPLPVE